MKKTFIKNLFLFLLIIVTALSIVGCKPKEISVNPNEPKDLETYTVSFNTNGGGELSAITVDKGKTVTEPTNPIKETYTFNYWYLDDQDIAFDFTTPIMSDITLVAKWGIVKYTVVFETNGGHQIPAIFVEDGEIADAPESPLKKDFDFVAWYLDQELTTKYKFDVPVTNDITIYAKYKASIYTLSFESNGGSRVVSYMYAANVSISEPKIPTKVGHQFMGWFSDETLLTLFTFDQMPNESLNLYAKWQINTYSINFESSGGTEVEAIVGVYNVSISEPEQPNLAAYDFLGWYTEKSYLNRFVFNKMPGKNVTLYAKWDIPSEERVNLDIALLDIPTIAVANVELPAYGRNGTRFNWSIDKPHLISKTGEVGYAGFGSGGEIVIITLLGVYGGVEVEKTFEVLVLDKVEVTLSSISIVDFINLANEYKVKDGQIELYFFDEEEIPYVDISAFITLLDGAIESVADEPVEIIGDDGEIYMAVYYMEVIEAEAGVVVVRLTKEYSQNNLLADVEVYEAKFDFNNNTYYSKNFDFHDSLGASTETDFGEGLTFGDNIVTEGTGLYIPFENYRIDLIEHENETETKYLMPLYLANLVFVGSVYYDVYYNGDTLYGIDSYQLLEGDSAIQTISTSSYNQKDVSPEMKAATYDYLALAFDYFYGLKTVNNVETYYDVFVEYAEDIVFGRDYKHYQATYDLTYALDDLHTYHILTGYYNEPDFGFQYTDLGDFGARTAGYYQANWAVEAAIQSAFNGVRPAYRVTPDGKTLIVVIDSFTVDTPKNFKRSIDAAMIQHLHIENIVVDITDNGGGNVGAVWRTLGYMTDDVIYYHSQNPTDNSTVTYQIYDEYPAYEVNWYILTSKVTFSAANLMAATAKEQGIATVIGVKSSGGASSISGIVLPTGDVLFMSSTNVISTKNELGEYISVEYGVDPDIVFPGVSKLYDDQYIENVVNQNNQP